MVTFELNGENLIFKEIPNNHGEEGIAFGLFRENGTQLGESFCRTNRFEETVWYLSDLCIFPEFERSGYGTELLEKTCEALWQREKMYIFLERPGNSIAPDGFDKKAWYERHGFTPHPNPTITFMWREPPN